MATAWASLTIAKVTDVEKQIRDVYRVLGVDPDDISQELTDKIALAKGRLKQKLVAYCKDVFPAKVEEFILMSRARYNKKQEAWDLGIRQSGVEFLTPGHSVPTDLLVDTFTSPSTGYLNPRVYYNAGVPTSATQAGYANIGSFCIDTTNWVPYINRGTQATPSWVAFRAKDMVDYIHNPSELIDTHVALTIIYTLRDGTLRSLLDVTDGLNDEIKAWEKAYEKALADALEILDWDIDNDGSISDYEGSRGIKKMWG